VSSSWSGLLTEVDVSWLFLGHGIGLEGHESPYLVGSNYDEVVPGNTFSNEPGIYIVGQVGIRLEDCWYLHEDAEGKRTARMLTGPAVSPLIL
jgi:Xaa-Pro aminopeptidase